MSTSTYDPFLDELLWTALAIGDAANVRFPDGRVNEKKTNRMLVTGALPAVKRGKRWVSTRRQLLGVATAPA
jgi:hypothetical protein